MHAARLTKKVWLLVSTSFLLLSCSENPVDSAETSQSDSVETSQSDFVETSQSDSVSSSLVPSWEWPSHQGQSFNPYAPMDPENPFDVTPIKGKESDQELKEELKEKYVFQEPTKRLAECDVAYTVKGERRFTLFRSEETLHDINAKRISVTSSIYGQGVSPNQRTKTDLSCIVDTTNRNASLQIDDREPGKVTFAAADSIGLDIEKYITPTIHCWQKKDSFIISDFWIRAGKSGGVQITKYIAAVYAEFEQTYRLIFHDQMLLITDEKEATSYGVRFRTSYSYDDVEVQECNVPSKPFSGTYVLRHPDSGSFAIYPVLDITPILPKGQEACDYPLVHPDDDEGYCFYNGSELCYGYASSSGVDCSVHLFRVMEGESDSRVAIKGYSYLLELFE